MKPIIKASSELRRSYGNIADICKTTREPVFLTVNGEGDTVLMDLETYGRRERDLDDAQRLLDAERARFEGAQGVSVDQFADNMRDAIARGSRRKTQNGA